MVSVNECDVYTDTIDNIEEMIEDDSKFPVVEDGRIKMLLKHIFEFIKVMINYTSNNTHTTKTEERKLKKKHLMNNTKALVK